jgi:cell division protein FtsA
MAGGQLSHDMLILHGVRNRLNDAIMVVDKLQVDVHDMACSGLCSALAVLTPEQKRSGAIVLDIGGGTTDYVAYAEGVVAAAGALGVGGDHITNDIGIAFSVPTTQAEGLKLADGSAVVEKSPDPATVSLAAEGGFPGRTINIKSLHTVVHLRCEEILKKVKDRLKEEEVLHHVGAGIVLTGGGAHLKGMTDLAEKVFGLPCTMGKPLNVSGLATATAGPEYATVTGLVQYGFRSGKAAGGSTPLGKWLRGLFKS